jgi:DNA (cytosine-5)-methyltransferase 1
VSVRAVDLFAGAGGFSTGARAAGVEVVWAANHWPAAVECHRANHPETAHACQDLHQVDWTTVPAHDLLLASPACQGHSRARGVDRPHHDACRSTAWAVVSCAEVHRPRDIIVENVPEFLKWALYPSWKHALQSLGYLIGYDVVDAADHGVPQHRRRLFVHATLRPIRPLTRWRVSQRRRSHVPARQIIDLEAGNWSRVSEKCERTRARIDAGRRQHGESFLVAYYGNERGGRSLDRPLGTVTTRDRYAVVEGYLMRMLTVDEYRAAMGFPASYVLPANRRLATHLLGNAVCPQVACDLIAALLP